MFSMVTDVSRTDVLLFPAPIVMDGFGGNSWMDSFEQQTDEQ